MPVTRMARLLLVSLSLLAAATTQARIVRVDIERVEPAFEGRSFGATGPYDRLIGRAHGVLDPNSRRAMPRAWSSTSPTSRSCARAKPRAATAWSSWTSSTAATSARS
jgi:hypothetical protein